MTAPSDLPSLISEGRRLIEEATKGRVLVNEYYHAVQTHEPGVPLAAVCYRGNTPAAEADLRRIVFAVNNLPLLLAVAEAAEKVHGYLEEETLYAKGCVGQDEVTGVPCEWHRLLLALDAAMHGKVTP